MGLDAIVRSGVALANRITDSLQVDVTHEAWTGDDKYVKPTFAAAVTRSAIVEMRPRLRRLASGKEVMAYAVVTFLVPIAANGAAGRREPIDPRDRITLPDGFTGPILEAVGVTDPTTNRPYVLEVVLGERTQ